MDNVPEQKQIWMMEHRTIFQKWSHKNLMCLEENEVQMFYITFRKPVHFNMTYNFYCRACFLSSCNG